MTKPRATSPQWSVKADEILADGQWHDGMQLVREIEKTITPGVALRRIEGQRQSRVRAIGKEGQERKIERSERRLIAMGKRLIIQAFILSRVKRGSYVTDPSPIPSWHGKAGWLIRDIRVHQINVTALAHRYKITVETVRSLVLADPPMPHRRSGRLIAIEQANLPLFEARLKQYRDESRALRRARTIEMHERHRQAPTDRVALSVVARQCGIAPRAASELKKLYPEVGWIEAGRTSYLPLDRVPDFEVLVEAYKQGSRRGQPREALVPAFKDEKLAELFQRYVAGERHLREEVLAQMRRAYHQAPDT